MAVKRDAYLQINETVPLTLRGITVWAYTRREKFLGKVEINRAGVAEYTGRKAGIKLCDMRWERFFEQLTK